MKFIPNQIIQDTNGTLWFVKHVHFQTGFGRMCDFVKMANLKAFADPVEEMHIAETIPANVGPFLAYVSHITYPDISDWKVVKQNFKPKKTATVVAQYEWAAVKEVIDGLRPSYDIWEWNLYKLKWVRLTNTACGFGAKETACSIAQRRSNEISEMLKANSSPPAPL